MMDARGSMKFISHYELSRAIGENLGIGGLFFGSLLFGSVEPDLNLSTYLKGVCMDGKPKGHDWRNIRKRIERLIRKLESSASFGLLFFYRFGKLLHYTADAFTFPHNELFLGTIRQHRTYERMLARELRSDTSVLVSPACGSLHQELLDLHERYLSRTAGTENDAMFIRAAYALVIGVYCEKRLRHEVGLEVAI